MASWLVPLFALAMSATFLVESFSLKRMPGADPAGPALYPRMVIAGTALAAIVILAQLAWRARGRVRLAGWRALFAAEGGAAEPAEPAEPGMGLRIAIAMALTVVYPIAILKIGFVLATFLVTVALMRLFDRRILAGVAIAAAVSLGLRCFFADRLGARIVPGEWFDPMRALGL